ncbi:MAG: hypothetical protein ABI207_02195 [Crocinitomicaceae bacterium]
MIDIKFTYDGKSYSSISDAIQKAMVDGIKESITKSLSPFESEIRKAGGHVVVDIPSNMKNMNIQLKNMPQELIERITKTLK